MCKKNSALRDPTLVLYGSPRTWTHDGVSWGGWAPLPGLIHSTVLEKEKKISAGLQMFLPRMNLNLRSESTAEGFILRKLDVKSVGKMNIGVQAAWVQIKCKFSLLACSHSSPPTKPACFNSLNTQWSSHPLTFSTVSGRVCFNHKRRILSKRPFNSCWWSARRAAILAPRVSTVQFATKLWTAWLPA